MAKGNTDFKRRLNRALQLVHEELRLTEARVRRVYTPVWRDRKYQWISPMDTDGLLVSERQVHPSGAPPPSPTPLRIGVVIQSEFTTSLGKPNPFGKALLDHLPLGLWVDHAGARVRLDEVVILFVVPLATAASKRLVSATAREK